LALEDLVKTKAGGMKLAEYVKVRAKYLGDIGHAQMLMIVDGHIKLAAAAYASALTQSGGRAECAACALPRLAKRIERLFRWDALTIEVVLHLVRITDFLELDRAPKNVATDNDMRSHSSLGRDAARPR
jgi:hypothetical protein